MLGPLRITAAGQEISGGMRKARELLVFLAMRPDGAAAEAISEALWPGRPPGPATASATSPCARPAKCSAARPAGPPRCGSSMPTAGTPSTLPGSAPTCAVHAALDPPATPPPTRTGWPPARGGRAVPRPLADGAGYDWAEPYAETARRRALDAWTPIAEILQPGDPGQALAALESALAHDPYNEYLYQKIMRLQAAAGRPDAVRRTLSLLEARLGELTSRPAADPAVAAPRSAPAPRRRLV